MKPLWTSNPAEPPTRISPLGRIATEDASANGGKLVSTASDGGGDSGTTVLTIPSVPKPVSSEPSSLYRASTNSDWTLSPGCGLRVPATTIFPSGCTATASAFAQSPM
jgi:hypothetical protein